MSELVRDIGEFALIDRLAKRLHPPAIDVIAGIGDDVAVIAFGGFRDAGCPYLLATCDVQVAGVHFLPGRITPYQLGCKVAAINLSDIAAMGGRPRHFLVSLAMPPDTPVAYLEALYDGLSEEARRHGADVVGGNMSRASSLTIDLTLLGEVMPDHLLRRSGAQAGDLLLVTGALGTSAAGLALVIDPELKATAEDRERCLQAHLTPTPRLAESAVIVREGGATAMIDISDGLMADLGHICEASGTGAELWEEAIPLLDATRRVAEAAGTDPLQWALSGGEDYELLFTARPDRAETLARNVTDSTGTPVTIIGAIRPPSDGHRLRHRDGSQLPLHAAGWDHFAR